MGLSGNLGESGDDDDGTPWSIRGQDVGAAAGGRHDNDGTRLAFNGRGHGGNRNRHRRIRGNGRFLGGGDG